MSGKGKGKGSAAAGGMDLEDMSALIVQADAASPGAALISHGTQSSMACCVCGTTMQYNPSAMCSNCLKSRVDITEGIPRTADVERCRGCGRYSSEGRGGGQWVTCELESKELMAICLKRVHGLDKVKLLDASFLWTEPHSKRLKVKLAVRKELFSGVVLQQQVVVEFVVKNHYCKNCHMHAAQIDWSSVVQVRQKVDHKRTFYLLEQLILKHKAHTHTVQVKEVPDGVDFYFLHHRFAQRFAHFVLGQVPSRLTSTSEKVYSVDLNNNKASAKQATAVEIVPLCKDDLLCLSKRSSGSLGSIGPVVVCTGITSNVKLIDPITMRMGDLRPDAFFKDRPSPLMSAHQATEYTVLDSEPTGVSSQGGEFDQAEVTLARSADLGVNDAVCTCTTHLGRYLRAGDLVLGYDVANANLSADLEAGGGGGASGRPRAESSLYTC
uniref:60S ribosomal export protein NMD3 n=2 Tax=Hemiselmis andersenii TaxID=464988 RepID=A0A7S1DDC8_HEMAN|mmetsp:Transcript_1051/g.2602  ORF Transcript_1051/g.2602 Transcript_1051/m.2602 type:complete len:439 (+) Transcript_1051:150-1466(+)